MITGINTVYEHQGREYHLQAEDLGEAAGVFEVRVYDRGSVLWQKRVSYAELLADGGSGRQGFESALRGMMDKTLLTVEAAIAKGKLPVGGAG
ncbi:MAG: hypothetical protein AAF725_12455 [Acidobacteriota bacterium]